MPTFNRSSTHHINASTHDREGRAVEGIEGRDLRPGILDEPPPPPPPQDYKPHEKCPNDSIPSFRP